MWTSSHLYANVLFWSNACTVGSTLPDSAIVKEWVDMNCCAPPSLVSHLGNMLFTQFSLTASIYLEKISHGLSKRPIARLFQLLLLVCVRVLKHVPLHHILRTIDIHMAFDIYILSILTDKIFYNIYCI